MVIASPEQYDPCKYKHSHSKTVYVELAEFVHRCIHSNNYVHDKPIFRRMGGSDNVFGFVAIPPVAVFLLKLFRVDGRGHPSPNKMINT